MHLLGIYLAFALHYEGLRAPFIVHLLDICLAFTLHTIKRATHQPYLPAALPLIGTASIHPHRDNKDTLIYTYTRTRKERLNAYK